jgi:molybdopterin synthase catalytic subunit
MSVTVLLFASIAEAAGTRRLELDWQPGDTVASLTGRLLTRHPDLERFVPNLMYAVDEEYAERCQAVRDGATLALIPPVSGGSQMLVRVTPDPLDPAEAIAAVATPGAGAINVFLGVVRDNNLGRAVGHLVYEAYPEMAEKVMAELGEQAVELFGLERVALLHRTGRLEIGETSLLIAISSGHRGESFKGGHWLVDEVKKRVPVWKKEVWEDGEEWIEGPESLGVQKAPSQVGG